MKLFLLGGFLGSGKTTAIQQACVQLSDRNISVGVITNDQGVQLVDSAFVKGFKIPNREVVNGCFCCNYTQLDEGIRSLEQENDPAIIFAESVGSCTDVVATVVKPLLRFHQGLEIVFSVFADALILLKMAKGLPSFFDDDVDYIYQKQLQEADVLVVNKTDLLSEERLKLIRQMAKNKFPGKPVLFQNSLDGDDIQQWLDTLSGFDTGMERKSLDIDYEIYGAGEAKLAWFDDEWELNANDGHAVDKAVMLVNTIYDKVRAYPIGHLKFLLKKDEWQKKISFTSGNEPRLKQTASLMQLNSLTLLVNARVQMAPGRLKQIMLDANNEIASQTHCVITSRQMSVFQPGFPTPAHRIMD